MKKNEIKQRLSEIRTEMQELEAKLNKPDKWEPKGGNWRIRVYQGAINEIEYTCDVFERERNKTFRTQSEEQAKALAKHLKNQTILWQLANELNGDWVPDWGHINQTKAVIEYDYTSNKWDYSYVYYRSVLSPTFSPDAARQAVDILNNMETGIEL